MGVWGDKCLIISKGRSWDPRAPPKPAPGLRHLESEEERGLFPAPSELGSSQRAGGKGQVSFYLLAGRFKVFPFGYHFFIQR